MIENPDLIMSAEAEAMVLVNYSMDLSKAFAGEDNNYKIVALENNLRLWVEIETSLKNAKNLLPDEIKRNLFKLSKFVESLTLAKGLNISVQI